MATDVERELENRGKRDFLLRKRQENKLIAREKRDKRLRRQQDAQLQGRPAA